MLPTVNELEKPNLPWINVEGEAQRLSEIGMLDWICHLRPTPTQREGPEDIPFIDPLKNKYL